MDSEESNGSTTTVAFAHVNGTSASRGPESARATFAKDAVQSVLLAIELGNRGLISEMNVQGSAPVAGGSNWRRPVVMYEGESTDNRFLATPGWTRYSNYERYNLRMNAVRNLASRAANDSNDAHLVEWIVLNHFLAIGEIYAVEALALNIPKYLRVEDGAPTYKGWRRARGTASRYVWDLIGQTYVDAVRSPLKVNEDEVLVEWYESFYLGAAHDALLGLDLQSGMLAAWESSTVRAKRRGAAKVRARGWLAGRMSESGLDRWGDDIARCGQRLGLGAQFASHIETVSQARGEHLQIRTEDLARRAIGDESMAGGVRIASLSTAQAAHVEATISDSLARRLAMRKNLTAAERRRLFVSVIEDVLADYGNTQRSVGR